MSDEIVTPVGRMVQGHPMEMHPVKDNNGQPKMTKAGQPYNQCYVGLAVPKGSEQHWNQTEWGAQIWQAGVAAWPRGECNAPTFAWKITDGDSAVPNKKGIAPNTREGFPGHWVIGASNGFEPDCFADGNYSVKVMRKERFKTGDYVRCVLSVRGNNSNDSPGIYVNLSGCELVQAGAAIISSSALDGNATFGAAAPVMPQNAILDPNMAAQAPATPVAPPAYGAPAAPVAPPQQAHNLLPGQG